MVYAGFWRRLNAYGVDSLLVSIITVLLGWFVGDAFAQAPSAQDVQTLIDTGWVSPDTDPQAVLQQLTGGGSLADSFSLSDFLLPLLVSAAYNIFFVAGNWQATPGKHWSKMQVAMVDGRRLTLLESAIRHVVSGLSISLCGLGYITMFFTKEKTALHDIICNTRVIVR